MFVDVASRRDLRSATLSAPGCIPVGDQRLGFYFSEIGEEDPS
jgi:hypothetical protein